jgi:hypothetical protein|tara:strand:- start:494 stop:1342 length:849 start_codon:yes stop_codon:yes gene_type:complete
MNNNQAFIIAIERILRPLVRSLIAQGIILPMLHRMLKRIYVNAAQDYQLQNKSMTDSRISLLTGVHRKDLKFLRESSVTKDHKSNTPVGARVLAEWTGNRAYLDKDGSTAALAKLGPGSFTDLVETVNTDIRPRTLLDDWLSKEVVYLDESDRVCLNRDSLMLSHKKSELIDFFGTNLSDHIATATHNLEHPNQRVLERATYYSDLRPESVETIRVYAQSKAMETLVEINKIAHALAQEDQGKYGANQRFKFGTYFYHSGLDPNEADGSKATKTDTEEQPNA